MKMKIELDKQMWNHELYMDASVWRLYIHMLCGADDTGEVVSSIRELAITSALSESQVRNALRDLKQLRYVEFERGEKTQKIKYRVIKRI